MKAQFKRGQRVRIVKSADPKYRGYVGRVGTVYTDGPDGSGYVAVKGLDSKLKEKVHGYIGFAPEDLQKV